MRTSFINPIKAVTIALAMIPIFFVGFIPRVNSQEKSSTNKANVASNTYPASAKDTFLYRQLGVNFLCRARMANVEFPKALGISSATFADVITQKHGGLVEELPDKKLTPKQLYLSAEIQILEGAIKFCPDNIPSDTKDKFDEFIKNETNKKESNKK